MSDITVRYKNQTILQQSSNGTKTLSVSGKVCEDDIQVTYQVPTANPPDIEKITYTTGDLDCVVKSAYLTEFAIAARGNEIYKPDFTQPFEIGVVFKVNSMTRQHQAMFGTTQRRYFFMNYFQRPSAEFNENGNGNIWAGFSTDGSSWTNNLSLPNGTVQTGVWYHFRYIWDGSVFKIGISTDFINYTEVSSPQTSPHYNAENLGISFGAVSMSNLLEDAYINLQGTYIKVNGNIVWGCDYCEQNRTFDIP